MQAIIERNAPMRMPSGKYSNKSLAYPSEKNAVEFRHGTRRRWRSKLSSRDHPKDTQLALPLEHTPSEDSVGRLTHDLEVGAATAVDPDAVAVVSPSAIVDAVGITALPDDAHAASGRDAAVVALHIVPRAIDRL